MSATLRRLRGILLMGVLWAIPWALAGGVITLIQNASGAVTLIDVVPAPPLTWLSYLAAQAAEWSLFGAVTGALFAAVVTVAERQRSLADLSPRRMAIWGLVGTLVPVVALFLVVWLVFRGGRLSVDVPLLVGVAALGAACGVGSLLLARRAPSDSSRAGGVAA